MTEETPASPAAGPAPADEELTAEEISEQMGVRLAKRDRLIAEHGDAYPVTLPVTSTIGQVRAAHPDLAPDTQTGQQVGLAGRIVFRRDAGKLVFVTLQAGDGQRLQAMLSAASVGTDSLATFKELADLGDHLFVHGEVIASRRGELSIMADAWQIAAKAVRPLPNVYKDLSEETRVRQRYIDLIVREQAREVVRTRATTMSSIRRTLESRGFVEIETPKLQVMHGGANARPFVTHSNAFDMELYLSIAPELFLKRAVVGGIERVFEIARNFRNEGADSTHSPEFAMLEAYQAYTDYQGIADLTQAVIQDAALAVAGSHVVTWHDGTEYDLGGDWPRISLYGSLSAAVGTEITPETPLVELKRLADAVGVEVPHEVPGKYVEELWEHHVKGGLDRPTFVMDFPLDTSPLTREHRSMPGVVEKWDLYVRGFELATGYSELVDPVVQRERFIDQARQGAAGDAEAMRIDEEFLRAMEYGMPPSGGMGMGVDRLLMALTGLGIRETILFPLVK